MNSWAALDVCLGPPQPIPLFILVYTQRDFLPFRVIGCINRGELKSSEINDERHEVTHAVFLLTSYFR